MGTNVDREAFRNAVFARDNHTCVVPGCGLPAVDAHHILERRLWEDGGYHIDNGASVCREHHLACEATDISVEDVRRYCGITKVIVPDHMYPDETYDKWGNVVLSNGQRVRGELFHDESVQKILADKLHLFTNYVKYPRTLHLPWSPGIHDDDRVHKSTEQWHGKEVVVGVKMDGENTSCYNDYIHARSINSGGHASRDWVKGYWARFAGDIPPGWRICGENMFAKHSIKYDDLTNYFIGFGVWTDRNICLNWDETLEWFALLGIDWMHGQPVEPNELREGVDPWSST